MKFFYDSEFIEGFLPNRILGISLPNWLSKRRHAIDLISISIVAEDGDTYTAISREYNYDDASDWVKKNVIEPLYVHTVHGDNRNFLDVHNFHKAYGQSNKVIAEDIELFIFSKMPAKAMEVDGNMTLIKHLTDVHLYGYFSAYDHVLLSSLFGAMMDLPNGFPMYTIDLKQMLDEKVEKIVSSLGWTDKNMSLEDKLNYIKAHPTFPKLEQEHLCFYDAKWNKKLLEFLEKY